MNRKYLWVHIITASIIGTLIAISLWGGMRLIIYAFEVTVSVNFFNHGYTRFVIPPIGYVQALTHLSPWGFTVTLQNIDLDRLTELVSSLPVNTALIGEIREQLQRALVYFVIYLILLAFLGGAMGSFLVQSKKRIKQVLAGGMIGLLIVFILLIATWFSFNIESFNRNPEFEGILEGAPWIFGLIEESLVMVDTLGERLSTIATNLYTLFERIENLEPLGSVDGDLKVLHVSDLHNNPAALEFIEQVINAFNVDMVIDTGDITDYGTPLEAELVSGISHFHVPYILVPGNHDSPHVIESLKEAENVTVLEKGVIKINGLTIAGIADPSAASTKIAVKGDQIYRQHARELLTAIKESGQVPHLLAVHHPKIAQLLKEKGIPLALIGHTHQPEIKIEEKYIKINAGTTGAAGIRGLEAGKEVPYSVVLLYFKQFEEELKPLAADLIKIFQFSSGFTIERVLLKEPASLRE